MASAESGRQGLPLFGLEAQFSQILSQTMAIAYPLAGRNPAGSWFESAPLAAPGEVERGASERGAWGAERKSQTAHPKSEHSTLDASRSTALILAAPMPVTEHEETRASTQLGAAQKDTARELGTKLASLRGTAPATRNILPGPGKSLVETGAPIRS